MGISTTFFFNCSSRSFDYFFVIILAIAAVIFLRILSIMPLGINSGTPLGTSLQMSMVISLSIPRAISLACFLWFLRELLDQYLPKFRRQFPPMNLSIIGVEIPCRRNWQVLLLFPSVTLMNSLGNFFREVFSNNFDNSYGNFF